uniref:Uncharacterized protein n=1 Tax=Arundo donax TaxID=35708 RepID=A0A0A9B0P4_ARUDO
MIMEIIKLISLFPIYGFTFNSIIKIKHSINQSYLLAI